MAFLNQTEHSRAHTMKKTGEERALSKPSFSQQYRQLSVAIGLVLENLSWAFVVGLKILIKAIPHHRNTVLYENRQQEG